MSFADFEAKAERHRAAGRVPGPHRRPHRVRHRADRRLLPRARDLPDRGLRPRPRRELERPQGRDLRRRRRLLAVRHQDDLHRRGRSARLDAAPRSSSTRGLPQLRQAELRGRRPELPHERVHRRARPGADRAPAGDRGVEERRRPRGARPGVRQPARAARRAWSRACTSTSSSTGSSARPVASTTSPATGSWATTSSCPIPTGWRETIPAFRCITGRSAENRYESSRHRRLGLHRLVTSSTSCARAGTSP